MKITHEEARNKVKSNHNKFYTEGEFTKDMLDYINQQEKKDERAKIIKLALEKAIGNETFDNDYIKHLGNLWVKHKWLTLVVILY